MWRRALAVALLAALVAPAAAAAGGSGRYKAEIRRTTGGMPHIKARDYGSLGFGYGYAYASDQICRFADIMATVNAERSRYFGPGASYGDLGGTTNNLDSDFFFARINASGVVERLARRRYPDGPGKIVRATVRGYVAGYNAYLRRTGRAHLPDPRCRGRAWVKPITVRQMYRRFYQLGQRASGQALLAALVGAAPPAGATAAAAPGLNARSLRATLDRAGGMGSNGYAIGSDGSRNGDALLLSNPHFPSGTDVRWYELHLTIPGKLDAIGAGLQGLPVVNLGFNRHVAWTHTVSTARRFAAYELKLAPGNPTSYLVDGRTVPMRRRTVRVRVRGGGTRSHTFYETRWGPVVVRPDATFTWTPDTAYALADANADQLRLTNQWAQWDRATLGARLAPQGGRDPGQPVGQLDRGRRPRQRLLRRRRRRPAPRPRLPEPLRHGQEPAAARRGRDRRARRQPLRLPPAERRRRRREGHLRAPQAAADHAARLRVQLERLVLDPQRGRADHGLPARLRCRAGVPARARGSPRSRPSSGSPARTASARRSSRWGCSSGCSSATATCPASCCAIRSSPPAARVPPTSSPAAKCWRRGTCAPTRARAAPCSSARSTAGCATQGSVFATPFDHADPLGTPSGLAPERDVPAAVRAAAADLQAKGLALDVPLGEVQFEQRGRARYPMSGCPDDEGCFNVLSTKRDERGIYRPYTGSSFVMAAELARGGPRGRAILRYSQSENPRSPYYRDQTALYAQGAVAAAALHGRADPVGPRLQAPDGVRAAMKASRPVAVGLVLAAVASLQLGAAFAVELFDELGPGGAAFLRLAFAAGVLWALWRPRPGRRRRRRGRLRRCARADEPVHLRGDGPAPHGRRGDDRVQPAAARRRARLAPPARRAVGRCSRRRG